MKHYPKTSADATAAKCELAVEVLRSFGILRFAATGWSMLPTVWPGDTLVVERIGADQFRTGEIALVGRDGRLCAHRIISLPESGNRFWTTQGDAVPTQDRPVIEGELLGRVTTLIRSGKSRAVPLRLNVVQRLLARLVRRSVFAARVFVYVTNKFDRQQESILPCQG